MGIWDTGPFAHWTPKLRHLNMAVDCTKFAHLKKRFNPPGKRRFFFIGNSGGYKGTHLLSLLFGLAKDQQCAWIGSDRSWPNLIHHPSATLDTTYMEQVAEECDFFVTMGDSDANPTTILEAMAWGFPVCCTPESGYLDDAIFYRLSTRDMRHNLSVLDQLQKTPSAELLDRAAHARTVVEQDFSWARFGSTVRSEVERLQARADAR